VRGTDRLRAWSEGFSLHAGVEIADHDREALERLARYAALEVWPELDAVGPRYYSAVQGRPLWSMPNNLHFVLANLGVPNDVLRAPLPQEGPRALLRYVRPVN